MPQSKRVQYHHITKEERLQIEAYSKAGKSKAATAILIGRNRSSVGRELKRNKQRGSPYLARRANRISVKRIAKANTRPKRIVGKLKSYVASQLKIYWSPEQIAGRWHLQYPKRQTVCHETIYQFVYKKRPDLKTYLRCKKGKYRRRHGTNNREKRREEAKKKRIDVRPAIVETRTRLGDWEGDTIVGREKTTHILTHADRKSGYLLADKIPNATAKLVRETTTQKFKRIAKKNQHTTTYDNGTLFAEHETLERDTEMSIYFAHPYHSWERGTNENTNGLLRQFFPKGSAFDPITKRRLDLAVKLINTRPRKRLNYLTPDEVFNHNCCTSL